MGIVWGLALANHNVCSYGGHERLAGNTTGGFKTINQGADCLPRIMVIVNKLMLPCITWNVYYQHGTTTENHHFFSGLFCHVLCGWYVRMYVCTVCMCMGRAHLKGHE